MNPTNKKIAAALVAFSIVAMMLAGILDGEPAPTPSPTECECVCEPAPAPDLTTEPQEGTET